MGERRAAGARVACIYKGKVRPWWRPLVRPWWRPLARPWRPFLAALPLVLVVICPAARTAPCPTLVPS